MSNMHSVQGGNLPKSSAEINKSKRPDTMAGGMKGVHKLSNQRLPRQGCGDKPTNKGMGGKY